MTRFEGKTVLVTGAAGALGHDLCRALKQEGAARIIAVDRDGKRLDDLARDLDGKCDAIACDLSKIEDIERAWGRIDLNAGLDLLVTAAGILGSGTSLEEIDAAELDLMYSINVRATVLTIQRCLPALRRNSGNVVTFGSTAGLTGSRALGAYSVTKGAVALLTRSLALSLAPDGIRVNSVCPGSIESPMLEQNFASAGQDAEKRRAAYIDLHPLKRFGAPREVTEAVLYLGSDAASYSTGISLPVDGGRLA